MTVMPATASEQVFDEAEAKRLSRLDDRDVFSLLGYEPRPGEWEFLSTLKIDDRQKVRRRLFALVRAREGISNTKAAAIAGVKIANFYRLKKAWDEGADNVLEAFAGYAARATRKVGNSDVLKDARAAANQIAADHDVATLSVRDISELISELTGGKNTPVATDAVARTVRQEARNSPDVMKREFGRSLLVDCTAISLVVRDPKRSKTQLANVALVMEEYSQLILAAVPSHPEESCAAQKQALLDAASYFRGPSEKNEDAARSTLRIIVGPAFNAKDEMFGQSLARNLGADNVTATGDRRFGKYVTDVIGPSFSGKIKFLPRSTQGGSTSAAAVRKLGREPVEPETAWSIVRQAVERHNRLILPKLTWLGVVDPRDPSKAGGITSALDNALLGLPEPHSAPISR